MMQDRHELTLYDVALTSAYLDPHRPVAVIVSEILGATHYQLKAYPVDGRYEFQFISDLTVRGKDALAKARIEPASIPVQFGQVSGDRSDGIGGRGP